MAKLKPWFHVVQPREDLREGRPMDASEFAVHLDHVREAERPRTTRTPHRFFERTYLTRNLRPRRPGVRRLSGIKVETSAVFNMATQFGGGKTHSLTAALPPGPRAGRRRRPGRASTRSSTRPRSSRCPRPRPRCSSGPSSTPSPAAAATAEPVRQDALGRDRLATRRREGVRGGRPARRGRCTRRAAT